jgi:Ca-activated chloride channel family protein
MIYIFEYPYLLLLLPFALCFIYCKKVIKKEYLPKLEWIPKRDRVFNIQTILKVTIFSLSIITLSSPISYDAITPSQKYGRDIVLALDSSGSMRESGFNKEKKDKSKFETAQEIISSFIDARVSDNIGVVVFGTFAYSASPITYDHIGLKELLKMLEVEIAGKNTAIGDGIVQSMESLKYGEAKNKIIILLTDGINNSGKISVKDAVDLAKNSNIKIYTINIGDKNPILQKIASQTNGKTFIAKDANQLQDIYSEIDSLNPSKIRSEQYLNKNALFIYPLAISILLMFWLLARLRGKI